MDNKQLKYLLNNYCLRLKQLCGEFILHLRRLTRLNARYPLELSTYDGGNQGLHPSCLYFKDGWNGFKFWFVFTPYKDMNDAIENPCVYVSNNGVDFTPIETANPLDDITLPKEQEYNSDPELVYNSDMDRLECWWRRVQTSEYPTEEGKNRELIYHSYTTDGKYWSDKELILNYKNKINGTLGVISPALIYEDGTYKMWAVCSEDEYAKNRFVDYYEMLAGGSMVRKIHTLIKEARLSHIDVIKDFIDGDYKLVGFDVSKLGFPYKLFSFNNPEVGYKYEGLVLIKGKKSSWDGGRLYRPSITVVDGEYWLYYSAYERQNSKYNHVGLIKFQSWKELLQCFIQ